MATYTNWNNQLKVCPYDHSHQVSATKYAKHIMNCAKRLDLPALVECPYNAGHRLNPSEYMDHLSLCPDQPELDVGMCVPKNAQQQKKPEEKPLDEGDWD